MRFSSLCVIVLAGLSLHVHAWAQDAVTILVSEGSGVYAEFAKELPKFLARSGNPRPMVRVLSVDAYKDDDLTKLSGTSGAVLVAVGTPAMTAMARKPPGIPVLNVLVSQASFRSLVRTSTKTQDSKLFSAVFYDQPWARQLALIRQSLPGRRVGVLLGKESAEVGASLHRAARDAQMTINIEVVAEDADLLGALRRLLPTNDALLAIPDATVYNRSNITSILLTSYRAKVPLFGFSPAYVKAGALAAVYSQPEQIAQQVAEIIHNLPTSGGLPPPQSPRYFSVSVNPQVGLSLELPLADEAELLRKLQQLPGSVP